MSYKDTFPQKKQMGKNSVRNVNWQWFPFFAGLVLAIIVPFLIDFVMFGTPQPCQTTKVFEDGSSLQACMVRK